MKMNQFAVLWGCVLCMFDANAALLSCAGLKVQSKEMPPKSRNVALGLRTGFRPLALACKRASSESTDAQAQSHIQSDSTAIISRRTVVVTTKNKIKSNLRCVFVE